MKPVLVRGDGVATYCCVHLLEQAGIPTIVDRPNRLRVPAILLSEAAIRLLADVFGREDLFRELPRIRTRAVLWGSGSDPVLLPHSAVVVSEETLLDSLRPRVDRENPGENPEWEVFASHPLPPESVLHPFGSRIARAFKVELKDDGSPSCGAESVDDGWLFLIGSGDGKGWLLSVGGAPETVLGRSRLIGPQIERLGDPGGAFPAYPRVIAPLGMIAPSGAVPVGGGWLACGTAAMAFDPICGDGTAHAVREAILAVAVIRAVYTGAPREEVLAHYERRLTGGFQRHLLHCADFYRSGGNSLWWRTELDAVDRGLSWCAEKMSSLPPFRYRLNGYELEAVA